MPSVPGGPAYRFASRRRAAVLGLTGLLVACSENFGPPPPDADRRLPVAAEGFVGPVPRRTLLSLAEVHGSWLLGTEAGVYRWTDPWSAPRCLPEHGGYADASGVTAVGTITGLTADRSGELVVARTRFVDTDDLVSSHDGGRSYQHLAVPVPSQRQVEAIYAWSGIDPRSSGRIAVAQGPVLYAQAAAGSAWTSVDFDLAPTGFGPAWQAADGSIWLAVESTDAWAVVRSEDGGASFQDTGLREGETVLALARVGDRVHRVTASHWSTQDDTYRWTDRTIRAARFLVDDSGLRCVLLGESTTDGQAYLGMGGGAPSEVQELPLDYTPVAEALILDGRGAVVGDVDATLHRYRISGSQDDLAFAGGELDWGAVATVPADGDLLLAQNRSGEVFRGRATDPASMHTLGSPLFQSQPRTLYAERGPNPGIFLGSFGVHHLPYGSVVWQSRNDGQFSYLLENYSGPVKPQVLDAAPDGTLWLGAIQGDGPYRSSDGGGTWERVHDGLGAPGSRENEDGLPDAPQVNAFGFSPDPLGGTVTWMATYRGGVQRLEEGTSPFWEQRNRGLVDDAGSRVDSCCVDTGERAVDVRDLVSLPDGTLLAATADGAYRLGTDRQSWEQSSLGLANRDLRALDVDPTHPGRVVAVAWGNAENEAWLFYSEDRGLSWIAVGTSLVAKRGMDVVWSRPQRNEVVAILQTQGAWRVELMP